MIRILCFFFVVLLLGAGFAWLADRPGDLVITFAGMQYKVTLMVAASADCGDRRGCHAHLVDNQEPCCIALCAAQAFSCPETRPRLPVAIDRSDRCRCR